ncbi:MAG: hypothetical protein IT461_04295 [Planctomycetes bacterium]|nr:hypothetical protein [Planctomycetota bacterium]
MDIIQQLTPAQESELEHISARCLSFATSTTRCNRARFENALRAIYLHENLPPPRFVWTEGIAAAALLVGAATGSAIPALRRDFAALITGTAAPSANAAIFESAAESLTSRDCASLMDDYEARIGYFLGRDLSETLNSAVIHCWYAPKGVFASSPVSRDLRQQIRDGLCPPIEELSQSATDCLKQSLRRALPGCVPHSDPPVGRDLFGIFAGLNAEKPAYHRFLASLGVCHQDHMSSKLALLEGLVESGFWCWPGGSVCVCSERPHTFKVNHDNRIHCDDGPAMAFGDGFAVYAIHGVEVPEHVVMRPKEITVEKIEAEKNAEVRRIMTERFGYGRYLSETGAKVLDMDMIAVNSLDEAFGSMPRALMEDKQGQRWLVGTDGSTKRVYYMRAPREANTCAEAHSALAGFDENQIIASS